MGEKEDLEQALLELQKTVGEDGLLGDAIQSLTKSIKQELLDSGALVEGAEEPEVQSLPTPQIPIEHSEAIKSELLVAPVLDEEMAATLSSNVKPQWPVSKVTLANAGPFGPALKLFLDDMEPLVGLLADEIGTGKSRFQDARNVIMAYGYLEMCLVIAQCAYVLQHTWNHFDDGPAQRQLRVAWLDDYPNSIFEHVGWGYNDDYSYGINNLDPYTRSSNLAEIIGTINKKYPQVPDWELRQSALRKLTVEVSNVLRINPSKVLKHFNYDSYKTIEKWPEFLEETQGYVGADVKSTFAETLPEVETGWSPEKLLIPRIHILKDFALAFAPPYTIQDMDLWRYFASETYEKMKGDEYGDKLLDRLYNKPYEPAHSTDVPDEDVFSEIFEKFDRLLKVTFDNSAEATTFLHGLINLQYSIASREHYLSNRKVAELQTQWNKYYDQINEYVAAEVSRRLALEDGSFMTDIDKLIGLDQIKARLHQLADLARSETGKDAIPPAAHIVFSGNPGTGKTTVAVLLGKIYAALGLLPKGHVVSVTRADLVAQYTGQTAPKVNDAVAKAMGGILFIDEAYTLKRSGAGESDNFGQEAIDALLTHMENKRGKFIVVAAGYPAEMSTFVDSNPGLGSRFSDRWIFDDYSEEELWTIFDSTCRSEEIDLDADVKTGFLKLASTQKKKKDFANARWVRTVFEEARVRRATRINSSNSSSRALVAEDLAAQAQIKTLTPEAIASVEGKLNDLVGLHSVKEGIKDLIAIQNMQARRAAQGLPAVGNPVSHLVFSGPPGTGKTTVARLVGQIYKDLGLLNSGHVVEAQRADMVAGYVGQTAIKTESLIDKAQGGVLFIDEAYTLLGGDSSSGQDFGQEAIDTLLKLMEDRAGEFVVIAAGYSENMAKFIASNPGLASRFGKTLEFEKWDADAIVGDIQNRLTNQHLSLSDEGQEALPAIAKTLVSWASFASGRSSRTFVERIIEAQARRVATDMEADLTKINAQDLSLALSKMGI